MTSIAPNESATSLQYARAGRLRDLIEPWSLRKLQVRTGLGRNYLASRLNGSAALSISDIEVLAPIIRMTPDELFADLLAVTNDKAPTPKGGGQYAVVPPEGFEPPTSGTNVRRFPTERTRAARDVEPRPIVAIGGAR